MAAATSNDPNAGPILKLLVFSLIIVVVPLGLFRASQAGDFDFLYHIFLRHINANQRLLLSGAVAVFGVNVVVIVYILLAFLEGDRSTPKPQPGTPKPLLSDKQ